MARPREFDREEALQKATELFWDKGFAATSTDSLLSAMGIGRQSLYNAFGDKRRLYLEVLQSYQERTVGGHLRRLNEPQSPLEGIRQLLIGLAATDDDVRALGCLGVGSVGEFGTRDPELSRFAATTSRILGARLVARIKEGQRLGEVDKALDAQRVAEFVLLTMTGLQLSARAGSDLKSMRQLANFAVDRLKAD